MREIDGPTWTTVPLLEWSASPDLVRRQLLPADRAPGAVAVRALAGLSRLDWSAMSDGEQLEAVAALGAARSLLDATVARGLDTIRRSGAAEADSGLRTVPWFARSTGDERASGRRLAAAGRTLSQFERFDAALREQRITMDHVRVLTTACNARVIDQLIAAEAELIEVACRLTVEAWRDALRLLIASFDADGPEPSSDHDRFTAVRVGEQLVLDGDLSGDQAIVFEQALGEEYRRQLRAANTDATAAGLPVPPPAILRARALIELVRRGQQVREDGTPLTRGTTEAKLVVRGDVDGAIGGSWADRLRRGRRILWGGRRRRTITHAQRAALVIRDGGCVFPGCDAPPSWCDGHHVTWWRDDGTSDIDNLVLVCRRHHTLAHHDDWTLEAVPAESAGSVDPWGGSQRFTWTHHPGDGAHARVMPATNATTRHHRHSVLLSEGATLDGVRAGPP